MVAPYDFENKIGHLSSDTSAEGRKAFLDRVIGLRKMNDPDIYEKIIVTETTWSSFLVSIATIIVVFMFMYAFYSKKPTQEVMVYGSIAAIGALIGSGLVI